MNLPITMDDSIPQQAGPGAGAEPKQEPVALWQYRWVNPANEPNHPPSMLAWKEVDHPHWQPLEAKLQELRDYRFNGKPCYEVRALVAAPLAVEDSRERSLETHDPRRTSVIRMALHRFMSDAYTLGNAAAQDKEGNKFKPGAAEAFLRDAKDAETILTQMSDSRERCASEDKSGMADEYQRWIDFYHAGDGDFTDFLRREAAASSGKEKKE